jgi:hypothetical protein
MAAALPGGSNRLRGLAAVFVVGMAYRIWRIAGRRAVVVALLAGAGARRHHDNDAAQPLVPNTPTAWRPLEFSTTRRWWRWPLPPRAAGTEHMLLEGARLAQHHDRAVAVSSTPTPQPTGTAATTRSPKPLDTSAFVWSISHGVRVPYAARGARSSRRRGMLTSASPSSSRRSLTGSSAAFLAVCSASQQRSDHEFAPDRSRHLQSL